eukprot:1090340-Pyramimonas_sp.AAC.1
MIRIFIPPALPGAPPSVLSTYLRARLPAWAGVQAKCGKARLVPDSMGTYNPITNQWIEPPKDVRYLDREASFFH